MFEIVDLSGGDERPPSFEDGPDTLDVFIHIQWHPLDPAEFRFDVETYFVATAAGIARAKVIGLRNGPGDVDPTVTVVGALASTAISGVHK